MLNDLMTKAWLKERKRDRFYRLAKKEAYRSRASYKLKQLNEKYRLMKEGDIVVDLGAAPGGWSQVAREAVGEEGKVIAVDIQKMSRIDGIVFLQGDITEPSTVDKILKELGGRADVIISDMSPKLSGNKSLDHARSVYLCDCALEFASKALKEGGNFLVKIFRGDMYNDYLKRVKSSFNFCKSHSPEASLRGSSEIYILGKGFKG